MQRRFSARSAARVTIPASQCLHLLEEQPAFASVLRQLRGALQLRARFLQTAQLGQKIPANTGQQMVAGKCRFRPQGIDDLEPRRRAKGHAERYATVQRSEE